MTGTAREISAGGVLYRRTDEGPEVACIVLKGGKVLALPKGLIDEGESPEEAASREVEEETGMRGVLEAPLGYIKYGYYDPRRDLRIFKLVHFFLFHYSGGDPRDHDSEVEEVRWIPLREAVRGLSYAGERETARRALELLEGEGAV